MLLEFLGHAMWQYWVLDDKPDKFFTQCQLTVVLSFLQKHPARLYVTNQFALRRNVHTTSADLQPGLDVEELDLDVTSLAVPTS